MASNRPKSLNSRNSSFHSSGRREDPDCWCNEPCVLRTVSKLGPNRGRKFWGCRDWKVIDWLYVHFMILIFSSSLFIFFCFIAWWCRSWVWLFRLAFKKKTRSRNPNSVRNTKWRTSTKCWSSMCWLLQEEHGAKENQRWRKFNKMYVEDGYCYLFVVDCVMFHDYNWFDYC